MNELITSKFTIIGAEDGDLLEKVGADTLDEAKHLAYDIAVRVRRESMCHPLTDPHPAWVEGPLPIIAVAYDTARQGELNDLLALGEYDAGEGCNATIVVHRDTAHELTDQAPPAKAVT